MGEIHGISQLARLQNLLSILFEEIPRSMGPSVGGLLETHVHEDNFLGVLGAVAPGPLGVSITGCKDFHTSFLELQTRCRDCGYLGIEALLLESIDMFSFAMIDVSSENHAEKTHSRKIRKRREQGSRVATSAKAGRYVATELTRLGRYVATELSPKLGRYVATELSPKLGHYVATELSPKFGRYVATEHVHGSVAT
ncbi:hypothetical protein F2Q68_00009638 [Brassica cretica]|uniref:Uncharacterized protein n=1 Tax=Brassica cretica TaxID=69181 RepID=A0A8S9L2L8_BRACR|nr:hypothetical protein F2Q68_00009638 [Brassica cretica]